MTMKKLSLVGQPSLILLLTAICNSLQHPNSNHEGSNYFSNNRMTDYDSYSTFNATSSFISRSPTGLEAESRHRHFSPDELAHLFRSSGCPTDEILLVCKSINETIVIENASFYSLPQNLLNCSHGPIGPISAGTTRGTDPLRRTFFPQLLGLPRLTRDLRQALNRRCSGLGKGQECSFNLELDHPESGTWGPGLIDIFFRCVEPERTNRFCDRDVKVRATPDGSGEFLMSPVYPKYYIGGRNCHWLLKAMPGQRIQLRFLDISLRERMSSTDPECTDSVSVSERGKTLMRMCGESNEDIILVSEGHTLEVSLKLPMYMIKLL